MFEDRFIQTFNAGDTVFSQGSKGSHMYVVLSGSVELQRTTDDGGSNVMASMGPGEIFGEMAIVDSGVRMASAVAGSPETRLVVIDQARFVYLTSQQPVFALSVMRVMAQRIHALRQTIDAN
ncbi:MAG: Crp/Fnr family transcriptional regulator [Rhodocyclaceae bacterium]|nr:Crp/Fnr family transcriptional regulator [Rhodocyclaceae bacterium]MDZ4214864.1 Crp/Fnr family transcriptional regulator [Rhodocyclaceae bacterium]